jgi:hypothetical protein
MPAVDPEPLDPRTLGRDRELTRSQGGAACLLALLATLALASCGEAEPQRVSIEQEAPEPSPEQLRTDSLRSLRQRQHELATEAERVDAEIAKATTGKTAYLALPEAAKVEAVRRSLEENRSAADLAAKINPEANAGLRDRLARIVALCEQRLALHDQRAEVERGIAALGEKP